MAGDRYFDSLPESEALLPGGDSNHLKEPGNYVGYTTGTMEKKMETAM